MGLGLGLVAGVGVAPVVLVLLCCFLVVFANKLVTFFLING